MRNKLNPNERKKKLTVTLNPNVYIKLHGLHNNISKYVEWLIYQDLRKTNNIDEMPL